MPITVGGKTYSDQEVKDFYANGGDDKKFAQEAGLNLDQQRTAMLEARSVAGNGTYAGDAGLQHYYKMYQQYNPQGAYATDYQGWLNDTKSNPHTYDAMRSGTFTGNYGSSKDFDFGGYLGPGTGHDFSFTQSGQGPNGNGGSWGTPAPASGTTGGSGGGTSGSGSSSSSGSSYSASGTPSMNLSSMQGATNMGVDPKTQTVAGQLETVLANDSPLIQQARTRALQTQNANGRLNSSMAAGAADSAMYDAALQIATPDANTYNLAAQTNAATANTFSRDANAYTRQQDMANFNVNANNWAAQQEAARQAERDKTLNEQGTTNSATATTNAAKTAAASALNNARAEFASKVSAISMNDTMDAQARTDAIESLKINYNTIIRASLVTLGWDNPDSWLIV